MQEDKQRKGEQKVNSGWGIQRSFRLAIYETMSHLVQSQEDYIWRAIRFLKTKECAFRLLPISPLRFFCSRVANVFTRDAGRVFLISSPLSLGDFLCVMVCLLCVEKIVLVDLCLNLHIKCVCFTCCGVPPQWGDLGLQGLCCAEVWTQQRPSSLCSLQLYENNNPNSRSDHSTTGQMSDPYFIIWVQVRLLH